MSLGLGRIESFDGRDMNFLISAELPEEQSKKKFKYWNPGGIWLDQGSTSSCVGHAWAHFIEDGGIMYRKPGADLDPFVIYSDAQDRDEWVGRNYHGTSIRAGAKVLLERGYISGYQWAFDSETLQETLLTKSSVVAGVRWYRDMFTPDAEGIIKPTGRRIS